MEKEYFVTWGIQGLPVMGTISRLLIAPHEDPKGSALQDLIVEDVYKQNALLASPDVIGIFSIVEMQSPVWCIGHTREIVVGGRAASLEAKAAGWCIHI